MARINGMHHVSLSVPSLDEARSFYVGWLGFVEAMDYAWRDSATMDTLTALRGTAGRMLFLRAGNMLLELFEYESPEQAPRDTDPPIYRHGYTHICLDVDDAAALHAELSARGMRFLSAPVASEHVCTVYGRDPFGNIIELQELRSDAVPSTLRATSI